MVDLPAASSRAPQAQPENNPSAVQGTDAPRASAAAAAPAAAAPASPVAGPLPGSILQGRLDIEDEDEGEDDALSLQGLPPAAGAAGGGSAAAPGAGSLAATPQAFDFASLIAELEHPRSLPMSRLPLPGDRQSDSTPAAAATASTGGAAAADGDPRPLTGDQAFRFMFGGGLASAPAPAAPAPVPRAVGPDSVRPGLSFLTPGAGPVPIAESPRPEGQAAKVGAAAAGGPSVRPVLPQPTAVPSAGDGREASRMPSLLGPVARPGAGAGGGEAGFGSFPIHAPRQGAGRGESKFSPSQIPDRRPGEGRGDAKHATTIRTESKVTQTGQRAAMTEDAFKPGAVERLAVACDELMVAVAQMRDEAPDEDINLVLGAPASEWERFGEGRWIFLHHKQQPHQPAPGLCGDFNNLEHLTLVAEALAGQVDHIYFDHQAMKDLSWNNAHLGRIRSMLVPDSGVFHFPLDQCGTGSPVRHSYQPDGEPTAEGILASSSVAGAPGQLPVDVLLPYNFAKFDKAMQMQAAHLCQEKLLRPAIFEMLGRTFDHVDPEEQIPGFLYRLPGRPKVQEDFLACRTESKRR
jgi:hypothetical protein